MSTSPTAASLDAERPDAPPGVIASLDGAPPLVTVRRLTKTYRGRSASPTSMPIRPIVLSTSSHCPSIVPSRR